MKRINCQVEMVTPILDDVYQVVLKSPEPVDFEAGQYLQVVMADDDKRPFSIANAPGPDRLELHLGSPVGNPYTEQVIQRLEQKPLIEVELPFGHASMTQMPERDVVIMVGGTGFSYAKSLIEYLNQLDHNRKVYLYWGGRNLGGLYLYNMAQQWHDAGKICFMPVIEKSIPDWSGHVGLVHEAVLDDFVTLKDLDVYIAGRFEMAAIARDDFTAKGLPIEHLHGDAYDFI
ncbi:MAG: NAD(P)H-flavin reductase [Candidatus Celerinatantimonas neptuna]|nr:MAG: NAD(P)H-flavin reductase [Candidatus Celerinatantimonas neptuna]